jgi:glycosyltransferase involved in cell wall biosynthesis
MEKQKPLVSVVMPAYNVEKYIGEAIESILNQTFKDFEFIILDDCSKDKTLELINKYADMDSRIVVMRNDENLKLARTLNKGFAAAQGKYVARMDADDCSLPERLAKQVDYLEQNPKVGVLGGYMLIMNQDGIIKGKRKYHATDENIRKHLFRYSPFCHPAIMIRKDIFDKTQGYIHEYNPAEDYDLYFQLGKFCQFANLKEELIKYRVVENSMTTGKLKDMELKTIDVRRKYFLEYHGSPVDLVYSFLQFLTIFLTPAKYRMFIFSKLRESIKV